MRDTMEKKTGYNTCRICGEHSVDTLTIENGIGSYEHTACPSCGNGFEAEDFLEIKL